MPGRRPSANGENATVTCAINAKKAMTSVRGCRRRGLGKGMLWRKATARRVWAPDGHYHLRAGAPTRCYSRTGHMVAIQMVAMHGRRDLWPRVRGPCEVAGCPYWPGGSRNTASCGINDAARLPPCRRGELNRHGRGAGWRVEPKVRARSRNHSRDIAARGTGEAVQTRPANTRQSRPRFGSIAAESQRCLLSR